jgi:hypothetical protein
MDEEKLYEVPKASGWDATHKVGKALLSAVPGLGGPAAELFDLIIKPPLEKRRAKWFEQIAQAVQRLEHQIDGFKIENLAGDPQFVSILMQASMAALRTHQQEKLEALKNAVLNSALPTRPEDDMQFIFLQHVDSFTEWHLRILAFLQDPRRVMTEQGTIDRVHKGDESLQPYFNITFPQLRDHTWMRGYIVKDLVNRGLANPDYLGTRTNPQTLFAGHLTPLGTQFWHFIKNPLPELEQATSDCRHVKRTEGEG